MDKEQIKRIRKKLIITQIEFAELLNVSTVTISKWERGIASPTPKHIKKIVEICKQNNIDIEI